MDKAGPQGSQSDGGGGDGAGGRGGERERMEWVRGGG